MKHVYKNPYEPIGINQETYNLALEQTKNSIKAQLRHSFNDHKELSAFLSEIKYEMWKELSK